MDLYIKSYVEEDPLDEHFEGDTKHIFNKYMSHLNNVQQELVAKNPRGWLDEFENRLYHFATEAGRRHGTHVEITKEDDKHIINVYSPRVARTMGKLPMSHRTPAEQEKRRVEEQLAHDQFKQAAMDRLQRGAKRMHNAGLQADLFAEGAFTIDPDAEDPRDIYRPK